jgi:3-hydroxyisobutyrate dehydrogenase-like beta-hydroxyacid dehydrogenase
VVIEQKGPKQTIGFIGMGLMGSRMALRILEAGYPLTVYNRSKDKTQPLARRGARVADTPRDLATECEIVMSSVADDAALEAVMFGPEGALAGARTGTLFIEMSTVSPSTTRRISEAAKAKGALMIDAPVSGSTPQAEQGSLLVLVGGDQDVYQKARPILDFLSRETYYMGPSGAGVTMKLVVNALLGLGLQAMAEAIILGGKAGLDKDRLLDVLGQMTVIAPAHKSKLENVRQERYPVAFPLRLMYKDFGLVLRLAAELSVPMPMTSVAQEMSAAEQAKGIEEDFSATIRLMEELAGLVTR